MRPWSQACWPRLRGRTLVPFRPPTPAAQAVSRPLYSGIHFAADGDGWVEVYRDGEQVLDRIPASTLWAGTESYAKIGYYRGEEIVGTGAVLHRDYRVGTTRAAVR